MGAVTAQAVCMGSRWGGPDLEVGGTRGAHAEHEARVCDLGRIKAQRLVEGPRALPTRKEGIRCGARCGSGGERTVGRRWRKRREGLGPTEG